MLRGKVASGIAAQSILATIGKTPLLSLRTIVPRNPRVRILAKAECFNPGGSVKDRPILRIIEEAEAKGLLKEGKRILDATSGNAGIAYAMIASVKGYSVELCLPSNASSERKRILAAFGARITLTNPLEGIDGAIRRAQLLYQSKPERYFYADQYNNEANWKAHYDSTASEIIQQTKGKITHFVAGVGTSGTLMGVGRKLREYNPKIKIIEVQPSTPLHGIEGLKHMENSIKPSIYNSDFADDKLWVDTEEAQAFARALASKEGILGGTSSGANLAAAMRVSEELTEGAIITVFPDRGERYLSESYWGEGRGSQD